MESKKIKELNKKYQINNYAGRKNNLINYIIINGCLPVLLSAPHAVKCKRKNSGREYADLMTGGIVEYLCNSCNCYGIIRNGDQSDNPNYDMNGLGLKYKQEMISLIKKNHIKLVLDLHGCKDRDDLDFCIGTNYGKNLNGQTQIVNILEEELSTIGKVKIDSGLNASLKGNISRYISEHVSIPCIQLEITNKFRTKDKYLKELVKKLKKVIITFKIVK